MGLRSNNDSSNRLVTHSRPLGCVATMFFFLSHWVAQQQSSFLVSHWVAQQQSSFLVSQWVAQQHFFNNPCCYAAQWDTNEKGARDPRFARGAPRSAPLAAGLKRMSWPFGPTHQYSIIYTKYFSLIQCHLRNRQIIRV